MNAKNTPPDNGSLDKGPLDKGKPPSSPSNAAPRSTRRESRYNRVQARKAAQKQADSRFYAAMFSIMGIVALFAILLAALSINGSNVDVSGMQGWARPWLGPFTKLEVAGVAFVGLIAASAYMRMRQKK